jgi:hypothetical protein
VGAYAGERVSTGTESLAADAPAAEAKEEVVERSATWLKNTRRPLYCAAFGEEIKPNKCHSEEEVLAQLTGKRPLQDGSITKKWTARLTKLKLGGALQLELNAWPCRGGGDPNCHAKLSAFASATKVPVIVNVVGDSGGYESGHREDPSWVAGATTITYTESKYTYSK